VPVRVGPAVVACPAIPPQRLRTEPRTPVAVVVAVGPPPGQPRVGTVAPASSSSATRDRCRLV
ncbi:MAG: hypothetical protein R6U13_09190, partial [Desulfatiglandaceae bacterium]